MDRIKVMELVRSYQVGELSRRQFLKRGTAALGSAAAAQLLLAGCMTFPNSDPPPVVIEEGMAPTDLPPATAAPTATAVSEQTVEPTAAATDEPAIQEEEPQEEEAAEAADEVEAASGIVIYPGPDGGTLQGYLAYPQGGDGGKGVIVIQEWWGLNDHIKDVADRFAAAGFVALAPDLYHGQVATEPDEARKLAMELDTPAAVAEIGAAADHLLSLAETSSDKVGIVGFCMGGGLVAQSALALEQMGAGAVFYGRPLSTSEAETVSAAMLGFIGTRDGISVASMEAMHAGFEEAGIPNELTVYEGAQHSFFNDTRASYDPDAASDAFEKTVAWFMAHL